jgi:hypothetical protein
VQLHRANSEFEAAGARLVLIGQATPRHAAHFRRRMNIDLPVLADEERVSYKAVGARQGSLGEVVGPRQIARGASTSLRHRVIQGRTIGHPMQLGAALVLEPGGRVAFLHRSAASDDNVSPEDLLGALKSPA